MILIASMNFVIAIGILLIIIVLAIMEMIISMLMTSGVEEGDAGGAAPQLCEFFEVET